MEACGAQGQPVIAVSVEGYDPPDGMAFTGRGDIDGWPFSITWPGLARLAMSALPADVATRMASGRMLSLWSDRGESVDFGCQALAQPWRWRLRPARPLPCQPHAQPARPAGDAGPPCGHRAGRSTRPVQSGGRHGAGRWTVSCRIRCARTAPIPTSTVDYSFLAATGWQDGGRAVQRAGLPASPLPARAGRLCPERHLLAVTCPPPRTARCLHPCHMEHQLGPPARGAGGAALAGTGARRAVPQECKTPVEKFPTDAFTALGYVHRVARGQKGTNGVPSCRSCRWKIAGDVDFAGWPCAPCGRGCRTAR